MKTYSTLTCAVISVVLAVALFKTQNVDASQMEADTGTINDFSNRLDTAQAQIVVRDGILLSLSNRLDECQSAAAAVSNRLTEAQSTLALNAEQITKLTQQVTAANKENQDLNQRITWLTNQVAGISGQFTQTQASLTRTNQDLVQAIKDYALLEDRFRRDVAERVLVERKFNSYPIVKARLKYLWSNSVPISTPERIYAGLNVEVRSNGECHVIAPE